MKTQVSALRPCNSPTTFDSVCPRQFALAKIGTKGVHQDYDVLMVMVRVGGIGVSGVLLRLKSFIYFFPFEM